MCEAMVKKLDEFTSDIGWDELIVFGLMFSVFTIFTLVLAFLVLIYPWFISWPFGLIIDVGACGPTIVLSYFKFRKRAED